jgi:8-oxo-dGTP pyrophosphatase MutT (NUDIX family)
MAAVSTFTRQSGVIPVKAGEVCLVTSSNGKRWVIPKGLIDPGHTAGEGALQEAWEEAGLVGILSPEPVGSYLYEKMGGTYHVTVFVLLVTEAYDDWPESGLRQRRWLGFKEAAELLEDRGLRELVRAAASRCAAVG